MRASRLLSILTTLQAKGQVTARSLADECEVSVRTIYRDVDALAAAGVPIYSVQGNSGGYRLLDGYRVRLNALSPPEAHALFLGSLARQATDLGMGAAAASARHKLLAALPESMRPAALRSRFHFDAPAWFAEPEVLEHLSKVADAVWGDHSIRFRYRSRAEESRRNVNPLGIVLKGGTWYLIASDRQKIRTFRVARMTAVTVLDDKFDYPTDFDLGAYWTDSLRSYEIGLHPNKAILRFSPSGMAMMEELLPTYIRTGAVIGANDQHGWTKVTIHVGSLDYAATELLRFGTDAEVLFPLALRVKMREIVASLAHTYRGPSAEEDYPATSSSVAESE